MHVKFSVLLCAAFMLGACSNEQAVERASEKNAERTANRLR